MIWGAAQKWLLANGSKIVAYPAVCQSQNVLVEQTWRIILKIGHSYLAEQPIPREYWHYSLFHSNHMLNVCSVKMSQCPMNSHKLVYGVKPDSRSLFPIFSAGYFRHKKDGAVIMSAMQSQTLEGIAICQTTNSKVMQFYNPVTGSIYTTG